MYEKILSIKRISNNSNRYDIEVKDNHNFFANNILVHNCQVLEDVLKRHKGKKCYISEKIDGTSVTYYLKECNKCEGLGDLADGNTEITNANKCNECNGTGYVFGVCSRNLELLETKDNLYWKIARQYDVENKLKRACKLNNIKGIAIQGEIYGSSIQENPLKLTEQKLAVFNIFEIDSYKYYDYAVFRSMALSLGFETVPIITDEFELIDSISELVKLSERKSVINASVWAEGIVIRPLNECFDMQMASGFGNGRISFKAINPNYLIDIEK